MQNNIIIYSIARRPFNDIMRIISKAAYSRNALSSESHIRTAWEVPEVSIWTNRRLIRRKGSCPRTFDFIGGNMSGLWQCSGRYSRYAGNRMCVGRGPAALPARGGCTRGLGRIHSYREAESHCRSGAADKAKAGDWSAVRTSALHCTTQMATKSGAGERRGSRSERCARTEGAICRHCITIDLVLHSFADIAKAIRMARFYKPTIGIVPFNVRLPFILTLKISFFALHLFLFISSYGYLYL